jgi:hypothetical protein
MAALLVVRYERALPDGYDNNGERVSGYVVKP